MNFETSIVGTPSACRLPARSACRDDFDSKLVQLAGKIDDAGLIGNRDQARVGFS